ncbi:MAG: MATE family efflux transporter, partial [Clostridiales bacterium]|nr:MATE family efflux transporter [Clostridiales bacterium]
MTRDMTTGRPAGKLIAFSMPLLVGTVFQQLYNMVDSIIVGQYVGKEAFAAVGATGSITFFVLGLVFGACSGFAIPVAQEFG